MLLCLSSGARPRYLDDIVRALAMPSGTRLQFRYLEYWLDERVLTKINNKTILGEQVIIAYIDQSQSGIVPKITPCRLAVIRKVVPVGTMLTITLEVTKFAFPEDIASYQEKIREIDDGILPNWVEENGTLKLRGKWFLEVPDHFCDFFETKDLVSWEQIVKALVSSDDFQKNNVDLFFHVLGIFAIDEPDTPVPLDNQRYYPIHPKKEYEVRIYHYHPKEAPKEKSLRLSASEESTTFLSNPLVTIDSTYDLKSVRFSDPGGMTKRKAIISFQIIPGDPDTKYGKVDFDLPIILKTNALWNVIQGAIIGIFVATPAIISMAVADKASFGAVAAALVAGCVAGYVSLFGYRRSI